MSILKTHNLQSPDSSSVNIALAPNSGMVVSGISTFNNALNIGTGSSIFSPATNTLTLGTNSSERLRITSDGNIRISDEHLRFDTSGKGVIFGIDGGSNRPSIIGTYSSSSDNYMVFNVTGSERLRITSDGITVFGSSGAPNSSNTVSIHPSDGMISFGMDGRSSYVTGTNSCYIYSGEGASGTTLAGELYLQSRSNVNRDIVFVTGSTPAERLRVHSSGALGIAGKNYGSSGQVLKSGGSGAAPSWGAGGNFTSYAIVAEVRSGTSDAGTLTANTWMTRAINTEIADPDGIVSISSNQFTLQAGTYLIEWSAPAWRCDRHTTRLYDVTNSAARGNATLEFSQDSGSYTQSSSRGFARVTISGATVYILQTRGNVTKSGDGLGIDPNNLASCIYAMAKIYKEV